MSSPAGRIGVRITASVLSLETGFRLAVQFTVAFIVIAAIVVIVLAGLIAALLG